MAAGYISTGAISQSGRFLLSFAGAIDAFDFSFFAIQRHPILDGLLRLGFDEVNLLRDDPLLLNSENF